MQLKLNIKEWQALSVALEKLCQRYPGQQDQRTEDDVLLDEIRKRMRSAVGSLMKEHESGMANTWLVEQREKVFRLEKDNELVKGRLKILTADDDEDQDDKRAYPRRAPKMPKPGRKGRRKR